MEHNASFVSLVLQIFKLPKRCWMTFAFFLLPICSMADIQYLQATPNGVFAGSISVSPHVDNILPYPLADSDAYAICRNFAPWGDWDTIENMEIVEGHLINLTCSASDGYPNYHQLVQAALGARCPDNAHGYAGYDWSPDSGVTSYAMYTSTQELGPGFWCVLECPATPSSSDPEACQRYFLWANPESKVQPKQCYRSDTVADPIDPATGSVIKSEGDCGLSAGAPSFSRYYDSQDSDGTNLGGGWHSSFSRHIAKSFVLAPPAPARALAPSDPGRSSLYLDPESACLLGFVAIQSRVPNATGATTQYVDGICQLIKNGLVIGSMPVYTNRGIPKVSTTELPVSFEVIRDDGQTIIFWKQNGLLRSSAGVTLRLVPTATGYLIFNSNDNVETYDSNGVLVAVQSRNGTTQTMGYTSGKLTSVTDDFGHKLIFTYDPQNRLISTTRQ